MGKTVTYTHRQNTHAPSPFWIPRVWPFSTPNVLRYNVKFDQTARYIHANGYDGWNKLFGLDCTPWTPGNRGWSYMWAWRWVEAPNSSRLESCVELAAYINRPDGSFIANQVLTIQPGEPMELAIYFGAPIRFIARTAWRSEFRHAHTDGPPRTLASRTIGPWFGGVLPAPHNINIQLTRV